jgi:hypothetical protein
MVKSAWPLNPETEHMIYRVFFIAALVVTVVLAVVKHTGIMLAVAVPAAALFATFLAVGEMGKDIQPSQAFTKALATSRQAPAPPPLPPGNPFLPQSSATPQQRPTGKPKGDNPFL